jgi:hypothetical protein
MRFNGLFFEEISFRQTQVRRPAKWKPFRQDDIVDSYRARENDRWSRRIRREHSTSPDESLVSRKFLKAYLQSSRICVLAHRQSLFRVVYVMQALAGKFAGLGSSYVRDPAPVRGTNTQDIPCRFGCSYLSEQPVLPRDANPKILMRESWRL